MTATRVRTALLLNGWHAASSAHSEPAFSKKPDGMVRLIGTVRGGRVGAAAFELPADCRPAKVLQFSAVPRQAHFGSIVITELGQVLPSMSGLNLPLSNVVFEANRGPDPRSREERSDLASTDFVHPKGKLERLFQPVDLEESK